MLHQGLAIPERFKHIYHIYFFVDFLESSLVNLGVLAAATQPSEAEELDPLGAEGEFDQAVRL